ncbi:adenylate/guanylate cyclase domain-containing protein [Alteromonas sp. a30]|uniref:adenylate/guanylate cyclase domain-containing protein n=1 Tax=Alteromonas sp. a30 TaxID=2730917 RepID=UPI002282EC63|nr:adenylate/guanylate cyclase domain-containing protein [Alteromonas sp. a30]MCY7293983.1 adenylate/guanylate cyclase domain-containing protein [Alteromonas sp. a30]
MTATSSYRVLNALSYPLAILGILHLTALFMVWHVGNTTHFTLVLVHLMMMLGCLSVFSILFRKLLKQWQLHEDEKAYQRTLIENMLPKTLARKTFTHPQKSIQNIAEASVLFADIQGFSKLAQIHSSDELVHFLDALYSAFDHVCQQYRLEKIKTIGDEYMAVAGAPIIQKNHAYQTCLCALRLQQTFEHICLQHNFQAGLRIGIHSGPIIAGIIGTDKLSYDIWGDTVNLASRMQSLGQTGKIQLSHSTYKKVKLAFNFEPPKQRNVKGQGLKRTHFLIGIKSHAQFRHPTLPHTLLAKTTVGY